MQKPVVAFDESGNTGQNLLDPAQPVFVLASVSFTDDETHELMEILAPKKGQEVHFLRFIKSDSGKSRMLKFCQSGLISQDKIMTSVFHKTYMVITKMVDMLVEPLFRETGFDLYKDGANIAMSNVYYKCTPAFCGEKKFQILLDSFVKMIRNKDQSSIDNFYGSVSNLQAACTHKEFNGDIDTLMATQHIVYDFIADYDIIELDPAVPAFVYDCGRWGRQLGCEFDIVHDKSKPIEHYQEIFSYLMAKDEPQVTVGYDRRKMDYPLKVRSFEFCDSKEVPQIQIADLISGAYSYVFKGILGVKVDGVFLSSLKETKLLNLPSHPLWPSSDVTSEALGTVGEDAEDPNDYVGELINRQKKKI